MKKYSIKERIAAFWSKVDTGDERNHPDKCWLWKGAIDSGGYGLVSFYDSDGKKHSTHAHRLAMIYSGIKLTRRQHGLHKCNRPPCCRPSHLYAGTQRQNMKDRRLSGNHNQSRKTHCPHGHIYDKDNTYISPDGRRSCRACGILRQHKKRGKPTRIRRTKAQLAKIHS